MNNKLKYLTAVLIALTVIFGSRVHASADEKSDTLQDVGICYGIESADYGTDAHYVSDNGTESDTYLDEKTENRDTDSDVAGEEGDADNRLTSGEDGQDNFFESVYNEIIGYASEILCALTLIGSVTLAVAYKKGLLPLLEKSLVSIGNAITKIKENTKESAEKNTLFSQSIDEKLAATKEAVDGLCKNVERLNESLENTKRNEEGDRLEKRQLRLVVGAQIDMLYDIFMSSALPQYQKDAVGERIAAMKEAMKENDCEE